MSKVEKKTVETEESETEESEEVKKLNEIGQEEVDQEESEETDGEEKIEIITIAKIGFWIYFFFGLLLILLNFEEINSLVYFGVIVEVFAIIDLIVMCLKKEPPIVIKVFLIIFNLPALLLYCFSAFD